MVITENPENAKKRKKDGIDKTEVSNGCNLVASPSKTQKLILTSDAACSCASSFSSGDPLSQLSQESSDSSSQESQESVSREQYGENQRTSSSSLINIKHQNIADFCEKEGSVLKLDQNHVFNRFLIVFSQESLPDKITYGGEGYNLTAAYDEFWNTFYNSPYYSEGHKAKIPRAQTLIDLELKSVVKILKRGWEEDRYWPNRLSRPFLESCLFGKISRDLVTYESFLEFIEPIDRDVIQSQEIVDLNMLNIFKKYCPDLELSTGDNTEISCIKAAFKITVVNMTSVIDIWSKELLDLIPMRTFNFLMSPSLIPQPYLEEKDLDGHAAPHKMWATFLLDWPEDKVRFYFQSLTNTRFGSECNLCGCTCFDAKHFLCCCDELLETLRLDRHDAVLKELLCHLFLAIETKRSYFSSSNDWKVLTMFQNEKYQWPEEMSSLRCYGSYPHIIVYSLSPEKKALIIEPSISWEFFMDLQTERKTRVYRGVKEQLEKIGFEVEFQVITLGSRGVLIPELYDLFDKIFGMKHSEISKALEKISQVIIDIPYQSKYYKDLMKIMK